VSTVACRSRPRKRHFTWTIFNRRSPKEPLRGQPRPGLCHISLRKAARTEARDPFTKQLVRLYHPRRDAGQPTSAGQRMASGWSNFDRPGDDHRPGDEPTRNHRDSPHPRRTWPVSAPSVRLTGQPRILRTVTDCKSRRWHQPIRIRKRGGVRLRQQGTFSAGSSDPYYRRFLLYDGQRRH